MHSNLATHKTNPTDPEQQPIHANTRILQNNSNFETRIYNLHQSPTSINVYQEIHQHNQVSLTLRLYYCRQQHPNHLCRKKTRPWSPTTSLHNTRQIVAAKEERPHQADRKPQPTTMKPNNTGRHRMPNTPEDRHHQRPTSAPNICHRTRSAHLPHTKDWKKAAKRIPRPRPKDRLTQPIPKTNTNSSQPKRLCALHST